MPCQLILLSIAPSEYGTQKTERRCVRDPGRKHPDENYAEASQHLGSMLDPSRRPKDPNKSYRGGARSDIFGERSTRSSVGNFGGDPSTRGGIAAQVAAAENLNKVDGVALAQRGSPPAAPPRRSPVQRRLQPHSPPLSELSGAALMTSMHAVRGINFGGF